MKKVLFAFCMSGMVLTACNSGTSTDTKSPDTAASANSMKKDTATWVAVDSATEMKAWMNYATPGEAHKALAKTDGNWAGQVTTWPAPGAPAATSTATMTNKMILGGRYQQSAYAGNFMGMPFEGMGMTGYDNYKKKFISTWVDNMGTGIMNMEGTWDSTSKTLTFTGSMISPANGKECTMKEVYTMIDDNHQTMEMYGPDPTTGKQFKNMEIKLARKK